MLQKKVLPRGFSFLEGKDVRDKYFILDCFIKNSKSVFTELVEFPPLAFLDDFKRASNTLGNKAYEFKDKKGRDLVLTPDSQIHVFNYFLYQKCLYKNRRYSWISPTFRYRHVFTRHFYQIGYTSINFINKDIDELFVCLQSFCSLIRFVSLKKIIIKIINPSLCMEIIRSKIKSEDEIQKLFFEIRNSKDSDKSNILKKSVIDLDLRDKLSELFKKNDISFLASHKLSNYDEYQNVLRFYSFISNDENFIPCIEMGNFHSSEILGGVGFIIEIDDDKFGDGGVYSLYGNKFDKNIKKVVSVCTGVNPLLRQLKTIK